LKKDQIGKCHRLACKYHAYVTECRGKMRVRDKLFEEVRPFMKRWIISVAAKKGAYIEDDEATSLSWDCFLFCLSHFKPLKSIQIPSHFYSYTKFYLLTKSYIGKEEAGNISIDNISSTHGDNAFAAYHHIEELKAFRTMLDENHLTTFDDALMSMVTSNKDRVRRLGESSLNYVRYHEAKGIFKIVIDFLIKR
jgi:hypothetical protein